MADFNFQRGSEWRKWDLHFHSPSSFDYKNKSISNEDIIDTLLGKDIRAVCITDHNIIDINRIKSLQKIGQTKGVVVLPGIEMRGEYGKEPINFIGIFSENCDLDHINSELQVKLNLNSQRHKGRKDEELYCDLIDSCKLIHDLGGIVSIHAGSKSNSIECIPNSLPVGMAQKKDIAENIDIFELGKSEDNTDYVNIVFKSLNKVYPMIVSSDNHNINTYTFKNNDWLWIKADLSFEGLKQILYEPESRVFIGECPSILAKVNLNKTKYIQSISIDKVAAYDGHGGVWFDKIDIPINSELVAIIGNKGSGKSALADIIGLLGNSKNTQEASFLNSKKFRKGNLAKNFTASLTWKSGDKDRKQLSDEVDPASYEKVKYLPQNWFETLCNDLDGKQFSDELEKVVFTHLTQVEKMGMSTFKDLIQYKSQSVGKDIGDLHVKLHALNLQVVSLISKLHPNYEKEIREKLDQKQRELQALEKVKPQEKENPDKNASKKDDTQADLKQIEELNQEYSQTEISITTSLDLQAQISRKLEEVNRFEQEIARFKQNKDSLNDEFNIKEIFQVDSIDKIITFTINQEIINKSRKDLTDALKIESEKCLTRDQIERISPISQKETDKLLAASLYLKLDSIKTKRDELRKKLNKPQEEYQQYLTQKKEWEIQKLKIEGLEDGSQDSTINYYKLELQKISDEIPTALADLKKKQIELSEQIYNKKLEFVDIYKSIKTRVDNIIASNQQKIENYVINIEAGFKFLPSFYDKVLSLFNLRAKGSFMEEDNARQLLKKILEDKDPNNFDDIKTTLETIISDIDTDARQEIEEEKRKRYLLDQIRDPLGFYDYLFGLNYLTENYQLKLDNKDLDNLSPGEKGALLLVFYLMLDQDDIPLIIDQPEDNLDNESVSKILVKFISAAKPRRQIIMVTHNPNLAVVADAEQIIHVQIDKAKNNTFAFTSGSIENDKINKKIVDILEGTMPAFDKRRLRYFKD